MISKLWAISVPKNFFGTSEQCQPVILEHQKTLTIASNDTGKLFSSKKYPFFLRYHLYVCFRFWLLWDEIITRSISNVLFVPNRLPGPNSRRTMANLIARKITPNCSRKNAGLAISQSKRYDNIFHKTDSYQMGI